MGRAFKLWDSKAMNAPSPKTNTKAELLSTLVEHVDITSYDARP
eukprot:gene14421-18248_t